MKWNIYTLSDPTTGEVRYVGKTATPSTRLHEHIANGCTGNNYWIDELKKKRIYPAMEIIESFGFQESMAAEEAERQWIAVFYQMGAPLTNVNSLHYDGGYSNLLVR